MKQSTPVHVKRTPDAPDVLISDSGEPLNLHLAGSADLTGVSLVVDEEAGTFTLTIPDAEAEE
jgi:hypothetical protein